MPGATAPAHPRKLPRTVIALGLVSLFNDMASEIVVPLIPILLASVLGAGPVALGLVEGVADAVAAFLKLWSGRHSDALGGRRKGLALAGYALSNVARPLLAFAGSWLAVLLLRSVDRVGKGLRSAPRDALVADATPPDMRGHAYGFQRALDNAGAVGGSLIAAAVLAWSAVTLPQMILLSAIPGALAVLALALGVQEQRGRVSQPRVLPSLRWGALGRPMRRYLVVLGAFTLARASETFLLLRGHELGMPTVELLLLWAGLSLAKAATSTAGGRLADRVGRGVVILVSWVSLAVSFALLAALASPVALWAIALGYGLCTGLGEGAERAVISDFSTDTDRGTAYGWYNLTLGLAAIPAGLLFGGMWHYRGPSSAFLLAALIAVGSVLLLRLWAWPRRPAPLVL
jgi:MFS family permease